ncbi:MAG: DUF3343 domain-containing protein [Rhizomicrobium sp.]
MRLFAFASLSQVQRLRRVLLDQGHFVDMVRTPRALHLSGCGFCLKAHEDMTDRIRAAAWTADIDILTEAQEPVTDVAAGASGATTT